MEEILKIKNLSVKYSKDYILRDFNLSLNAGETLCILGKNGCGKSTLLNTIYGLLPVSGGQIIFEGNNITDYSVNERLKSGIGYLPQDNALFKRLKVRDHLKLASSVKFKYRHQESINQINMYFENFIKLQNKYAGQLSGGERRKLGLAILLLQGAKKLWLLDEPSASVDKAGISEIFDYISRVKKEHSISVLLVEQNRETGEKNSDKIFEIN